MEQAALNPKEQLMLEAFRHGATPSEAALHSGLPYSDVMEWIARPGNREHADELRKLPVWKAKMKVAMAAAEDERAAQWLLTHSKDSKAEWSDRTEHTGPEGKDLFPKPLLGGLSDPLSNEPKNE
jgi:hypothetical protein